MKNPYKLIYNLHSGRKWWASRKPSVSLEEIRDLLTRYQIAFDEFPTQSKNHAFELGQKSKKEGYKTVIVAGGDGTVGEVANSLVHSGIPLGILPLGSYMNIAKMLSIPRDLEQAVQLIKIGRKRKIDVGSIVSVNGEIVSKPSYFVESIGMGLEAEMHQHINAVEKGDYAAFGSMLKTLFYYYGYPVEIIIDGTVIKTRATMITIANGPYSGASFIIAPDAKLNDHRLTVSLFYMTKFELFRYFYRILPIGSAEKRKIKMFQAKTVEIRSRNPRLVHADARLFGTTPIQCTIVPNALDVITGFPTSTESSLAKRTYLDP
ncbi:MAG: diacylglycerol kinase family lipid kinase [Candidatus Levybacteria bacterium]|nr:diacylglycerol kinase family lipid kinase [Candidatus Levybacteria bacterium]